jgi:hypothetical protein
LRDVLQTQSSGDLAHVVLDGVFGDFETIGDFLIGMIAQPDSKSLSAVGSAYTVKSRRTYPLPAGGEQAPT